MAVIVKILGVMFGRRQRRIVDEVVALEACFVLGDELLEECLLDECLFDELLGDVDELLDLFELDLSLSSSSSDWSETNELPWSVLERRCITGRFCTADAPEAEAPEADATETDSPEADAAEADAPEADMAFRCVVFEARD